MGHENGGWMNDDQRDSVKYAAEPPDCAFASPEDPRWEGMQAAAGEPRKQSMLYEVCPHCGGKGGTIQSLCGAMDTYPKPCCKMLGVVETGATAGQLRYMANLDTLRQEAGITAAMLRDGRARQTMVSVASLRHGCLAALGFFGGVSILTKEQLQKVLVDAVKASGSDEKWSSG